MRRFKTVFVAGLTISLIIVAVAVFAQDNMSGLDALIETGLKTAPGEGSQRTALGTMSESEVYTLGKDDVIAIAVRNQPEFSGEFVVGPDGDIQYTFVGDIRAEGLTKEDLQVVLSEKLEQYVKVPEVSVTIVAYLSKFVYMLGEVGAPGKYPMKGDQVSLREALVAAGLPTAGAALRRSIVVTPDEVLPRYRKVDIYELLYKGIMKDNVTLSPGDVVVVPATVPTELNRAMTNLLSPIVKAGVVYELINGN
ncbi:polysaccharide biosynthesis/export family protein [Candidatus Omnitrophota bacterium]